MLKIFLLIVLLYLIIDAVVPLVKRFINSHSDNSSIHKSENMNNSENRIDNEDIIDADFQELDDEQNEDN
ncbi:MAG: hypothetical protein U9N76_04930 [Candidatus Marinimicrobia bacterium]|nr:hypothetical protein [Candidatus Neomarinimicrobiota bacterium]